MTGLLQFETSSCLLHALHQSIGRASNTGCISSKLDECGLGGGVTVYFPGTIKFHSYKNAVYVNNKI